MLAPYREQRFFTVPAHKPPKARESEGLTVLQVPFRAAVDVWIGDMNDPLTGILGSTWKLFACAGTTRMLVAQTQVMGRNRDVSANPNGSEYVLGARNIMCDRFDVVCEPPTYAGAFTPSKNGTITAIGRGEELNGPPKAIPEFNSTNYNPGMVHPLEVMGGAGEFGTGATVLGVTTVMNNQIDTSIAPTTPLLVTEITGFYIGLARAFLFLYDQTATDPLPANGSFLYGPGDSTPYCIKLETGDNFSWTPRGGHRFGRGCRGLVSSTKSTLTKVVGSDLYAHIRGYF